MMLRFAPGKNSVKVIVILLVSKWKLTYGKMK